jgi:signal peptidase I
MTVQSQETAAEHSPLRRGLGTVLFGTLLSLLLLLPIAAHFAVGWGFSPVLSQSMRPKISAGDLLVTRPVAVKDVAVGDIVVLRDLDNHALFSHRVVKVTETPTKRTLTTQGDANPVIDRNPAVLDRDLMVPVETMTVPFVGLGVVYLASSGGRMLGILLLASSGLLLLLRFVYRRVVHRKGKLIENDTNT